MNGFEQAASKIFRMDAATWERHANPWSFWTRAATLPLIALTIWSRTWLDGWVWLALAAIAIWLWLNPRLFKRPACTTSWASRAVFGERVLLDLGDKLPAHHRRALGILKLISALGLLPAAYGLWQLEIWPTLLGIVMIYLGKMWFLDRMAWLYDEMKELKPEYASWLYDNTSPVE